jgi:hypothetical protein
MLLFGGGRQFEIAPTSHQKNHSGNGTKYVSETMDNVRESKWAGWRIRQGGGKFKEKSSIKSFREPGKVGLNERHTPFPKCGGTGNANPNARSEMGIPGLEEIWLIELAFSLISTVDSLSGKHFILIKCPHLSVAWQRGVAGEY